MVGVGAARIPVWSASFESFKIGDEVIHDPRIYFDDWAKYRHGYFLFADADMLLGADFLRSHRVLVSHSQRRMYFTYAGGAVFPVVRGRTCADLPTAPTETRPGTPAN